MSMKKGGLGKGLDAIFMENDVDSKKTTVSLRISEIEPNKDQPRSDFDNEALTELADSIARHGIIQPLLVRPLGSDGYQIVAGERRWRACRMAGVQEVPVVIKELSDLEVVQLALIENLQREDLSPIEEAKGYKALMQTHNFTQEEVSKSVGKSRPAVTNALRLLSLPDVVMKMVAKGDIGAGHARALLALKNENQMICIAKAVVEKNLSVREVEALAKKSENTMTAKNIKYKRPVFFQEVEISLKEQLGRKIKVSEKKQDKGVLEIEFYSQDDLAQLVRTLGKV